MPGRIHRGAARARLRRTYAEILNQSFHRQAHDAARNLDGYVAARCALADGLDLDLWRGYQANAIDPVAQRILSLCAADKQRHVAFGWHYLESRAPAWTRDDITVISEAFATNFEMVERRGYHCAWLVPEGAAAYVVEADRATARAGGWVRCRPRTNATSSPDIRHARARSTPRSASRPTACHSRTGRARKGRERGGRATRAGAALRERGPGVTGGSEGGLRWL